MLALIETAGIIRTDELRDTACGQLGLELVADLDAALGLAASLGVIGGALVDADKYMALKARHPAQS
jgi:hypothetical protein